MRGTSSGLKPMTIVKVVSKSKLKRPPFYRVLLINDDYTPMDFVVQILQKFFSMAHENAVTTMYQVHRSGKAICGIYSHDVAETKVQQVTQYARSHQYPLLCRMEAL